MLGFATSTTGESSSFDIKVHIPQEYLLEVSGPEKVGLTSGGGTSAFNIDVNNLGNGDDNVFFEVDSSELPDTWSVSAPMSRTIPIMNLISRIYCNNARIYI